MVDCYGCESGFGPMFIEIVTLLRFEIPGAIGELENKVFQQKLTEITKKSRDRGTGSVVLLFSPPGDRELKRTSVTNQCLLGFLRFAKCNKRIIVTLGEVSLGHCLSGLLMLLRLRARGSPTPEVCISIRISLGAVTRNMVVRRSLEHFS